MKIVGERIKEYGFTYELRKEYIGPGFWGFSKDVNGITQMITIQEHRFRKSLFLNFSTTAWGKAGDTKRAGGGIPLPKGRYSNDMDLWDYETDEDFKKVLLEFADIIEKFGLEKLDEMMIEEEIIPTNEMGGKIISSAKELSEKFIEKHKIDAKSYSEENISKWFEVIRGEVEESADDPYESVQEMLAEIAAFLGEQLRNKLGGEWRHGKQLRRVYLDKMNSFTSLFSPLARMVECWKYQEVLSLKEEVMLILDGELPLSDQQKIDMMFRYMEMGENRAKYRGQKGRSYFELVKSLPTWT